MVAGITRSRSHYHKYHFAWVGIHKQGSFFAGVWRNLVRHKLYLVELIRRLIKSRLVEREVVLTAREMIYDWRFVSTHENLLFSIHHEPYPYGPSIRSCWLSYLSARFFCQWDIANCSQRVGHIYIGSNELDGMSVSHPSHPTRKSGFIGSE